MNRIRAISIRILPMNAVDSIHGRSRDSLPLAVLTTDEFDPETLIVTTVRLGDGFGFDTPVRMRPTGSFMVAWEDVDGDGRPDLILHFSVPSLIENGDLTAATTHRKGERP
jgi:hypothetical protein